MLKWLWLDTVPVIAITAMNEKHEDPLPIEPPLQHQFLMLFLFVLKQCQLIWTESGENDMMDRQQE